MNHQTIVSHALDLIKQHPSHPQTSNAVYLQPLTQKEDCLHAYLIGPAQQSKADYQLPQLQELIVNSFASKDLDQLCFTLGINQEEIPRQLLSEYARELLAYMDRRSRLPELIAACRQLRPDRVWPQPTQLALTPRQHLAIIINVASRTANQVPIDVARHFDEQLAPQSEANFLLIQLPNGRTELDGRNNWNPYVQTYHQIISHAHPLTTAVRQRHIFMAGAGPLLFAMGAVWGTNSQATLYHFQPPQQYLPYITVDRNLHT